MSAGHRTGRPVPSKRSGTMTWKGREAMADEHAPHHALLLQFLGALLQRTVDCPTAAAHQQALQGFLDDLTPWVSPADLPTLLGQPFTLFDHLAFTPNGIKGDEDVWVALSPGGKVLFRAWLRQRGLDPLVCSSSGGGRSSVHGPIAWYPPAGSGGLE